MKKIIIFLFLLLPSISVSDELILLEDQEPIEVDIPDEALGNQQLILLYDSKIEMLQEEIISLKDSLKALFDDQKSLEQILNTRSTATATAINQLAINIAQQLKDQESKIGQDTQNIIEPLENNFSVFNEKISWQVKKIFNSLENHILYLALAFGFLFISLIAVLIYLRWRIEKATLLIDENHILSLIESNITSSPIEKDHEFILKIADEISRIQRNLERIDKDAVGLKALTRGVERVQANFLANGYEITNLLGQKYDEGMVVDVISFIDSNELTEGSKVITKVITPQVIYNGLLIQRAQVEVTQN